MFCVLGCLFAGTSCLLSIGTHVGCNTFLNGLWVTWALSVCPHHLHTPRVFWAPWQKHTWGALLCQPGKKGKETLDSLGTVNKWENFLSYTAGWHLMCSPRHECFDSTVRGSSSAPVLWSRIRAGSGPSRNLGTSTSHLRLAGSTWLFGKDSVPWFHAKPWWCNSLLALSLFVIISDFCIGNFQNSCLVQSTLQNSNNYWNHRILETEGRTNHCEISLYLSHATCSRKGDVTSLFLLILNIFWLFLISAWKAWGEITISHYSSLVLQIKLFFSY